MTQSKDIMDMPTNLWIHEDMESIEENEVNGQYNRYYHKYIRADKTITIEELELIKMDGFAEDFSKEEIMAFQLGINKVIERLR